MFKKGYKQSTEHRKKIGEGNKKGKYIKCLNCGKKFWITPWEEKRIPMKKYCGRECFKEYYKKNFAKKGKENRFWKEGSLSYIKKEVLKRDKHICQECGFSEKGIMEVHHKTEVHHGGENSMNNCTTLCPNCHRRKTNIFLKLKNTKRK